MCNGLWVLKMHRSSSAFLTQYWCAPNCSTDVLRELDWWSGSRQHLDFCQFGYQVSLVRRGIWLLACSESAGFFFLRFKQKVKWQNINATFRLHFKVQDMLANVNQPTNAYLECGNHSQLLLKIFLLIRKQLHLFEQKPREFWSNNRIGFSVWCAATKMWWNC